MGCSNHEAEGLRLGLRSQENHSRHRTGEQGPLAPSSCGRARLKTPEASEEEDSTVPLAPAQLVVSPLGMFRWKLPGEAHSTS